MKHTIYQLLTGVLLLFATACTANYEEINSNPYQPGDLTADDYLLGAAMNALAGCVISPDVNTAQFTDALMGGPLGGYFAPAKQDWTNTVANYNPTDDWTNVFLKSKEVLPVLYTNLGVVRAASERTGNPVPAAIAEIIKVAAMHRIADTYGPIPYSQIGVGGNTLTPYDSLEDIYARFFEELNTAIAILSRPENQVSSLVPAPDYVYGGDVTKWVKFANSLKLRLAMRVAYADRELAQRMAEEAVADEGLLIVSNAENAAWNYFASSSNLLYVAVNYNRVDTHEDDGSACVTTGDTHAAADIICYMNGYEDPRRAAYFTSCEWSGRDYVGLRRGIVIPNHSTTGHKYSGVKIAASDALLWMNAAEVAFLRAEGAAVFGFNMGGQAREFYERGVRLSFEQWGVAGADDYLADETKTPEAYDDPSGAFAYPTAPSTVTIKWEDGIGPERIQERIITQKWIANWPLGNEAWADYRRTGYPQLLPATDEGNKSHGIVDSQRGARRMPYPNDEYVSNAQNVADAVQNYLNGPDNMATDLWWACKTK